MTDLTWFQWPKSEAGKECEGAVTLSFDDGRPSQWEIAIPLLTERGLRATFYVPAREDRLHTHSEVWRAAVAQGHEVGNHTIHHRCTANYQFHKPEGCLEFITLEEIEKDVLEASKQIREALPEQEGFTFCYPCYQTYVGMGVNRQSYVPVIARNFIAARGWGERANHPELIDLHCLCSRPFYDASAEEMIQEVEKGVQDGRWAILTFHGIAKEPGRGTQERHLASLADYLAANRHRIWTDTVYRIAKYIAEARAERADKSIQP
ncbi:MAG: polysaccharide deacetylase family protein [Planctomycetota bacterium]